jgi:hypothetical protein
LRAGAFFAAALGGWARDAFFGLWDAAFFAVRFAPLFFFFDAIVASSTVISSSIGRRCGRAKRGALLAEWGLRVKRVAHLTTEFQPMSTE